MPMKSLEEARTVLRMPDYQTARGKIGAWGKALEKSGKARAMKIEGEVVAFFDEFRVKNPVAYGYLAVGRKALLEKIEEKITGKRVIID